MTLSRLLLVLLLTTGALAQEGKQSPAVVDAAKAGIGKTFSDPAVTGGLRDMKLLVVAFSGRDCPVSKLYKPRLENLTREYAPKSVRILIVPSDDPAFVALLNPDRTTEAFVLDAQGVLQYRGAVDDQYGIGYVKDAPSKTYLIDALQALLAGKAPPVPATEAPGCLVEKISPVASPGKVTFHKDIEPIFQKRCVDCHRPGEIGPFSLLKYEKAKSSAKQIKEVVVQRRMPPWHADPKHGEWKNDRRLTDREIETIAGWVDGGAPEGDPKDAPPAPTFVDGWRIGTPDTIVTLPRKQKIPAEGTIAYRNLFVPSGIKEDKWAQAVEIRPSARSVVHHVLAYIIFPLTRLKEQPPIDGINGYVGIYLPGEGPTVFPEGMGKHVPAGATIAFQIHYTAIGEEAEDQTQIGFIWAREKPAREVVTHSAKNVYIKIPPGAADHPEEGVYKFAQDTKLLSLLPHLHTRGKSFKYVAVSPDGTEEVLLDVPRYDFNWQIRYWFKEPKLLKAGTEIRAYARFDNSKRNPFNPDPTKEVHWGPQTWDEMLVGYMDFVKAD